MNVFSRSAFLAFLGNSDEYDKNVESFKNSHKYNSLKDFVERIRDDNDYIPDDLKSLKYMLFTYTRPYRIEGLIKEINSRKIKKMPETGAVEQVQTKRLVKYIDITSFQSEKESLSHLSEKVKNDKSFDVLIIGFPGKDTWKRMYQIKHSIDKIHEKDKSLKGKIIIFLGMYTSKDFLGRESKSSK